MVDVHRGEVTDNIGRSLNVRSALGGLDPAGGTWSSLMGTGEGTPCSADGWWTGATGPGGWIPGWAIVTVGGASVTVGGVSVKVGGASVAGGGASIIQMEMEAKCVDICKEGLLVGVVDVVAKHLASHLSDRTWQMEHELKGVWHHEKAR